MSDELEDILAGITAVGMVLSRIQVKLVNAICKELEIPIEVFEKIMEEKMKEERKHEHKH